MHVLSRVPGRRCFAGTAVRLVLGGVAGLTGCGGGATNVDAAADLPGPDLQGPNVIRYPLGPYEFQDPVTEIRQGLRDRDGGCSFVAEGTLGDDPVEEQEIVVAEDPDTCQFLIVKGQPR
jgi:hypothetical protein